MDNTIIQQGSFVSTGGTKTLNLRSDVDWIKVYNMTELAGNQTNAVGVTFYWQRGFGDGSQLIHYKSNAANAADLDAYDITGGFSLIDTSKNVIGTLETGITAVSNAAIPVVSDTTHGLVAGDVVRLVNITGAQQLGGFDFTVGHNTLTANTFSLDYMSQIVAGTTGSWRKINYDPLFYPRRRYITKITQAAQAVVTMSVKHGYTVGQKVRLRVPAAYGMTEMNGLQATIVAVDTTVTTGNSITLDVDSTAFAAFAFPLTAATPFTPAEVIPFGEDSAEALDAGVDTLGGSTENTGIIGLSLTGGANYPGGANADQMFWVAGKSFSVDNEVVL